MKKNNFFSIEYISSIGKQYGLNLISKNYVNNSTKLTWVCENFHLITRSLDSIQNSLRQKSKLFCRECKKEEFILKTIKCAKQHKGKVIIPEDFTRNKKISWFCEIEHNWFASYRSVVQESHWCPRCIRDKQSKRQVLNLDVVKNNIKNKNGILLSNFYTGNLQTLEVLCLNCDNIFYPKYREIQQGCWCPECSFGKSQRELKNILSTFISNKKIYFNFRKFNWLKREKGAFELDFYIPDLKLAIEYDGSQHFKPIEFFGGLKGFRKTKQRDFLKNKLIHQNKQDVKHFIRIPYWEELTEQNIRNILTRNGIIV